MKYPTEVALAYCIDNKEEAQEIATYLEPAVSFHHFYAGTDNQHNLFSQIRAFDGPILLLISDNFLRSPGCMHESLAFITKSSHDILPIIIPGTATDEKSGIKKDVATQIGRNKDIIRYINFWQDCYLDLRKQKREDPELNNEGFELYLKKVRSISSNTGEFLRKLSSLWHLNDLELKVNEYEQLFIFLDAEEIGHNFKRLRLVNPLNTSPDSDAIEEEPAEEVLDEDLNIDLAEIPGISLLGADDAKNEETDHVENEEEETEIEEKAEENPESEVKNKKAEEVNEVEKSIVEEIYSEPETEIAAEATVPLEDLPPAEPVVISPEEALTLAAKAWNLAEQGSVDEGLTLLDAGIENHQGEPIFRYHKALMLAHEKKQFEAAKAEITAILQNHPDHLETLLLAGEIADFQKEPEHARNYFEQIAIQDKRYPEIWYNLGILTLKNFVLEKEETYQYFRKAVKYEPKHVDALYQLALLTKSHAEKSKKARKLLKRVVALEPDHPFAHYDLALLYYENGTFDKANEFYQTAAALNPEFKTAQNDAAFERTAEEMLVEQEVDHQKSNSLQEEISRLEALVQNQEQQLKEWEEKQGAVLEEPSENTIDRIALVTGASAGIGRATAEALAAQGYRVIITGRRKKRLTELKKEWEEKYNTKIRAVSFDVRDAEKVQKAIDSLPKTWSNIDLLVNNAGKAKGFAPIQSGDTAHWDEMIDTNIKGLLYVSRAVSPGMVARQSGHIINVCSTAGKEVYPNGNVYCATKFAVDAITKGMRIDLHTAGVRVSMISPAHVEETEFALVRFDGDEEKAKIYEEFQPLKSPDVAEQIVFIASQPQHVNILDIVVQGTQQPHSMIIDRSGRERYLEEE